jgi:hypothetical protein
VEVTASSRLLSSFLYAEVFGRLLVPLRDLPSNARARICKVQIISISEFNESFNL